MNGILLIRQEARSSRFLLVREDLGGALKGLSLRERHAIENDKAKCAIKRDKCKHKKLEGARRKELEEARGIMDILDECRNPDPLTTIKCPEELAPAYRVSWKLNDDATGIVWEGEGDWRPVLVGR